MRTLKVILYILPLAAVTLSSCKNCNKCRRNDAPETWICRDDYATGHDYHDAVAQYEAMGYDCDDYSK
jgi:hypothetical protein